MTNNIILYSLFLATNDQCQIYLSNIVAYLKAMIKSLATILPETYCGALWRTCIYPQNNLSPNPCTVIFKKLNPEFLTPCRWECLTVWKKIKCVSQGDHTLLDTELLWSFNSQILLWKLQEVNDYNYTIFRNVQIPSWLLELIAPFSVLCFWYSSLY